MQYTYNPKPNKDVAEVAITQGNDSYAMRQEAGKTLLSIGIGDRKEFTLRQLTLLGRRIIALAKTQKAKRIALNPADFLFPNLRIDQASVAEILATNLEMGNYEFTKYRTPPKEGWNAVQEVIVQGKVSQQFKRGIERGRLIGTQVNEARTLSNIPGGEMTPQLLAESATLAIKGTKVRVKVLGLKAIQEFQMGGILGVSQGSVQEPRFIILEYSNSSKKSDRPLLLIGKGVTFDSGGINLKPEQAMFDMHMDMAGGAAVIHALVLAAKLGIKKNIVCLVPAAENMPSGSSYRPGDILKTMSGKTVEILSTDAEGRLIMADAFTYAKRYNPKLMVGVATLTGAALAALGQKASALFTSDEKMEKTVRELGEQSGDYVWPLPLWKEYEEDIKGTFADLNNTGKSRWGGAITGALFLKQFAEDYPFLYFDIAPRMTSAEGDLLSKGAAGAPVRLLVKIFEKLS